jgi:hypothetical protein
VIAQPHDPGSKPTPEEIRMSLHSDRGPRNIRGWLPATDHEAFDVEYRAALRRAGEELDLAPLHQCVDSWWRLAVLKADPDGYAQMLQTADRLQQLADRGEEIPAGRPWREVLAARVADLGVEVEIGS